MRIAKARFDRGELEFPRAGRVGSLIIAMAIAAAVSVFLTVDPFDWFSGPPETADLRGELRAACALIVIPLFLAWWSLVRPLRDGMIVKAAGGMYGAGKSIAHIRKDRPSSFWLTWSWYALILAGMLVLGVYGVVKNVRQLKKLSPPPNHTIQRMGASPLAQFQFGSRWRLPPTADGKRSAT